MAISKKRSRRSLAATSDACSSVTSCLSEGSTECDRSSGTCPPCLYALSSGDYSCYSLDSSGDCPYSGTFAICATSNSGSSSSSSSSTPSSTTSAPAATTAAPASTTAAPSAASSSSVLVTVRPESSSTTTSSAPTTTSPAATTPSPSSGGSNSSSSASEPLLKSTGQSSSSIDSSSSTASASNTGSSQGAVDVTNGSSSGSSERSPLALNLALITAGVVLVVVVAIFVIRRVLRRKRLYALQEGQNVSLATPTSSCSGVGGGRRGTNLFALYSDEAAKSAASSVVVLAESQGTNSSGQPSLQSMASISSSTTEFAVGPQFRPDYSGTTSEVSAASVGHHFVDLSASTASNASTTTHVSRSMEDAQLASQLANRLPQAIVEEEEYTQFGYRSGRRPMPQLGASLARGGRALRSPYSNNARDLGASSTSTASGRSDDYDIVDPATLREAEHRNTELLMQDGRFVKFSFASDADLFDVDDEFDEHGRRQDEHAL